MKSQLLGFASFIYLLASSNASPVSPRDDRGDEKRSTLLGTSFGIPGNQTFDYVIVGGGTAGILQLDQH